MHDIDKEQFGGFLAGLRKEKGMTQKELAEVLYVSDKAVSKWERGLSLPDISLLEPLADTFGVTVTELLRGERLPEGGQLGIQEVEHLVTGSIGISVEEERQKRKARKRWAVAYGICAFAGLLETGILYFYFWRGVPFSLLKDTAFLMEAFGLIFGGWFCLGVGESLPSFYDENRISFYGQGIFRMNLAGIRFTNRNWPSIVRVGRRWWLGSLVLSPLVFALLFWFFPEGLVRGAALAMAMGFLVPVYAVGKRYE